MRIKLNDESYRYETYLMFNIYYGLKELDFVKEDADFNVDILENKISLSTALGFYKEQEIKGKERREKKEEIKRFLFKCLEEITKEKHPWGILVGIRPSKIALAKLQQGKSYDEIVKFYEEKHLASKEKAELCIKVAEYEAKFVNKERDNIAIYVGMAFCPTRCSYCSFTANPIGSNKKLVPLYLEALKKEIRETSKYMKEKKLKLESIYFGGGTPTAVNDEEFEDLMKEIYNSYINVFNPKEFTVECGRADSITKYKLETMKKYKVNRISVNPQTMSDNTLKSIGRNHTSKDVIDVYNMAREVGFHNINMDIIVGLPNEGYNDVKRTCEEIAKLKPESLTVHGMSVKRASKLHENLVLNKEIRVPKHKELMEMYDETRRLAEKLNMEPYYMYRQKNMVGNMENIGYSIKGKECIYNMEMIEDKQTIIALGADAVSKVVFLEENRIERFANVKDVKGYVDRIDEMIEGKIKLLNSLYKEEI